MKIIINNAKNAIDAMYAFDAAERAIQDGIKQGRNNFKCYRIKELYYVSVCKNKDSYTCYIQKEE